MKTKILIILALCSMGSTRVVYPDPADVRTKCLDFAARAEAEWLNAWMEQATVEELWYYSGKEQAFRQAAEWLKPIVVQEQRKVQPARQARVNQVRFNK